MTSLNETKLKTIIESQLHKSINGFDVFIESGTLMADTSLNVCHLFDSVHTIELSEKFYNLSKERIENSGVKNITQHFGDSSTIIPKLLKKLKVDTCVFFLDGHWSSGDTAKGNKDCPLIEECCAINNLYSGKKIIILIDDFRLFGTYNNENWSDISEDKIKECFTNFNIVRQSVYDDVLSLYLESNF